MKTNMLRITSSLEQSSNMRAIRRNELVLVSESLERQIADGIKAQAACKVLYLLDTVIKHYDEGQARIHNDGCRKFMIRKLGQAVGYQVTAKASDKLVRDVEKLVQGLQFEAPTNAVLQLRWRPANNQLY